MESLQKSVELSQRIQNNSKKGQYQNNTNNHGAQYPSMKLVEQSEPRAPPQLNEQEIHAPADSNNLGAADLQLSNMHIRQNSHNDQQLND